MNITTEWAKQLAFEVIGHDLDFANMRILSTAPGVQTVKLWGDANKPPVLYMFKYYDAINQESTRLAYYPKRNLLFVGETYPREINP